MDWLRVEGEQIPERWRECAPPSGLRCCGSPPAYLHPPRSTNANTVKGVVRIVYWRSNDALLLSGGSVDGMLLLTE